MFQSCVLSALPADLVKTRRFQHFRQYFRFLCSVILVYSRLLCCGFDANAHFGPFQSTRRCQKELSKGLAAVCLGNKTNGAADDITMRR